MALAETAKLVASLELKDHFTPAANKAMASLGKLESRAFRVGQNIGKGFQNAAHNIRNLAIVGAAGIAVAVKGGISSLADLEDATTSVDGAIKQMGQTGKVTSGQIATWANEIEEGVQAAFDDKAIVQATATLIRFGKVTTSNIRPAMQVITDLATKTGDVDSAASLLAKALADPTKAAGKLARQGVILTKEQQKQIAAFVKAGKVGRAQKVILDSLAASTKGAAAASAGPYRDALNTMADVTEDAQKALGIGFLPVITKVSKLLSGELAKKSTLDGIKKFGEGLASGLDSLIEIARNLPWATIGDSLKIAGAGAKTLLGAFTALPPWVQTAVLTGWGLNKLTGGALGGIVKELSAGLIKGVLGINAGVVNIKAGAVTGAGGVGGAAGTASKGGNLLATAAKVFIVGAAVGVFAELVGIRNAQSEANRAQAGALTTKTNEFIKVAGIPEMQQSLRGILATDRELSTSTDLLNTRALAFQTNLDGVRDAVRAQEAALAKAINAQTDPQITAVENMKSKMAADLAGNKTAIDNAAHSTSSAAATAGTTAAAAARSAGYGVEAAVRQSRPIVTTDVRVYVTAAGVTKSTTEQTRYGPGNGSAGGGDGGGAFGGH